MREWMRRHGRTPAGQLLWSDAEVALLYEHYPDYATLVRLLPHRTRKAIGLKVAKLGLAGPLKVWADDEVFRFKPPYRGGVPVAEILPLLNQKTTTQLYGAAWKRRIRRPRRRPKLVGVPILDSIRQRAFDMNITLTELDEATGVKGYFTSPRSLRWRPILKAIDILGGKAVVRWPMSL